MRDDTNMCICSYSPGLCTAHPTDAPPATARKDVDDMDERAEAFYVTTTMFAREVDIRSLATLLRAVKKTGRAEGEEVGFMRGLEVAATLAETSDTRAGVMLARRIRARGQR